MLAGDCQANLLKWQISDASELLHFTFETNVSEEKQLRLRALSQDLKNFLGLEYVIDCTGSEKNDGNNEPGAKK